MPKLEILRKLSIIFLIIITLFSLTGCNKNKDDSIKKEKVNQEMSYLDSKIIAMLNRLNNISFSNYKVVSEDVKEEKSGTTNGNEKNASSQEKFIQDTGSSSSNSKGSFEKADNQDNKDNKSDSNDSSADNQDNKDNKSDSNDSSNEKDSTSSTQSSDDSRKQSNF